MSVLDLSDSFVQTKESLRFSMERDVGYLLISLVNLDRNLSTKVWLEHFTEFIRGYE